MATAASQHSVGEMQVIDLSGPFEKPSPTPTAMRQPVINWQPYMLSLISHRALFQTLKADWGGDVA